ncbi:MAG: HigA family addiction module antitoxin [Myxococcota bacterium]
MTATGVTWTQDRVDSSAEGGLTAYGLAKAIQIPPPRIYSIIREKRGITADTALRLARYFGATAELWMGLQGHYDLEVESDRLDGALEREIAPRSAAG